MLTCTYNGVPQPSVLWYVLNGDSRRNIPVSDAEYVVDTISTTETQLTIRNVGDEDVITYGCEATNTVNGSVMTGTMELDIDICCKKTTYIVTYFVAMKNVPASNMCGFLNLHQNFLFLLHEFTVNVATYGPILHILKC